VEYLDPTSVLLNPGIASLQLGCPTQPLNIPYSQQPLRTYYYGVGRPKKEYNYRRECYETNPVWIVGGVISKTKESIYEGKLLTVLDPTSPNKSKGAAGFVKRAALYGVGDDLKVKPLSANSFFSYFKELSLPLDDIELKVISIGEAEVRWIYFINKFIIFYVFFLISLILFTCGVGLEFTWSILDI
jgi:hypothetical protein